MKLLDGLNRRNLCRLNMTLHLLFRKSGKDMSGFFWKWSSFMSLSLSMTCRLTYRILSYKKHVCMNDYSIHYPETTRQSLEFTIY